MARYAIVEAGIVVNVIEADPEFAADIGAIRSDDVGIGWSYSDGAFTPVEHDAPDMAALRVLRLAMLSTDANERVLNALPDMNKAQAIRAHQATLAAMINSKMKPHTLAAIDLSAGWPE